MYKKFNYEPWTTFASAAALNKIWKRYTSPQNYELKSKFDESEKKMARGRRRYGRGGSKFKRRRKSNRRRGGLLKKIKRINSKLFRKGIFNIETKYLRTGVTLQVTVPAPNSSSSNITNIMSTLTRGEDFDEMNGGKIFVKNLRMQYFLRGPSSMPTDSFVRVMVVRDKQPASPSVGPQLLQLNDFYSASIPTTQSDADLAMMNWKYTHSNWAGRFQVLYSRLHVVSPDLQGYYAKNKFVTSTIRVNKPWYTAATEAQTNDAQRGVGQLYLVAYSNAIVGTPADAPYLNVAWRASFTDC